MQNKVINAGLGKSARRDSSGYWDAQTPRSLKTVSSPGDWLELSSLAFQSRDWGIAYYAQDKAKQLQAVLQKTTQALAERRNRYPLRVEELSGNFVAPYRMRVVASPEGIYIQPSRNGVYAVQGRP
jgi:hypothetical protein